MSASDHLEIERKFLIVKPDPDFMKSADGVYSYDIEQIYLPDINSGGARIRRRVGKDGAECFYTVKKKISALVRIEDEKVITEEEYYKIRASLHKPYAVIEKTRFCVPCGRHTAEIDIYPFWEKTAVMEIELENERDTYEIPDFIKIIRDVTGEGKYTNREMAYTLMKNGFIEEVKI